MTIQELKALITAELARAEQDGIGRDILPSAQEGQLAGYLAGLKRAINMIED